ncbi:MAG: heparinase II/III family protein, partial [Armatimonadota bacterium]|nr:heparinase II/III family protein [Armatimonadota bacterium]
PVVPESDPPADPRVDLVPAVQGKHPRLLFTAADIPALRALAQGEGKPFFEQLERYRGASKPPTHTNWQRDATDAQRQGMWRLPTVALHYVLTGDKRSFEDAAGFLRKFLETEDWEVGEERNSGMAAANIMVGAGLAYDWLYNDLDPPFREALRKKLLLHARWQYYGGHKNGNKANGYWQADPQNNHRWHRDAGLTLCALAVAGDGPGWEWIVSKTLEELRFVHQWLPEDGSCHESPSYMVFGMPYLVLAFDAADRCLGTRLLQHPFFKANLSFRMHTLTPGLKDAFHFGDSGGTGFINNYLFRCAAVHRERDLQAAVMRFYEADPQSFQYGWFSLVWYDPTLRGGSLERVPVNALYPDLGLAAFRDRWSDEGVALMFKCGPYGGFKLNDYRNQTGSYINIAHDDPDCGMFTLFAGGKFVAENDRYANNKGTASHNTLLVNGKGQRGEGPGHWMQPIKGVDMNTLARIVTWKDVGRAAVAEGEAAKAYVGLDRFRRTVAWVPGGYVLVLDHIRGEGNTDVTWLLQAPVVETVDAATGAYRLKNDPAACDVRIVADRPFTGRVAPSPADHRGRPLGFQQIQLNARVTAWRVATLMDPWKHGNLRVALKAEDDAAAVVTVTGTGIADTWTWRVAPDGETPSTLKGERDGAALIEVGPADRAPAGR